jgi:hypothetical protein
MKTRRGVSFLSGHRALQRAIPVPECHSPKGESQVPISASPTMQNKVSSRRIFMRRIGILMLVLFTGLVSAALPQAKAQTKAQIITFDAPGAGTGAGQGTLGFGVTPAGVIMGEFIDAGNVAHGFVRSKDGAITPFDAPGAGTSHGQGTVPNSINPAGVITGDYIDANGLAHGFVRAPDGPITTFDAPGAGIPSGPPCSPLIIASTGTQGASINPAGAIAGQYVDTSGVFHGFLRAKDGTITPFDAPGAGTGTGQGTFVTFGDGINPAAEIAGAYEDANCVLHPFLRAPDGTIIPFDAPGAGTGTGQGTDNSGINPVGTVTSFFTDASDVFHGYVRAKDGTFTLFDVTGGGTGPFQGTEPLGLNAPGDIVGAFIDANGANHGFLRAKSGAITKFDAPGAGTASGQGTIPFLNNPADAITGFVIDANGVNHGFLRTP